MLALRKSGGEVVEQRRRSFEGSLKAEVRGGRGHVTSYSYT